MLVALPKKKRAEALFLLSKADSNHHKQNQNLLCYHYTIGQSCCLRLQRYKKKWKEKNEK